MPVLKIEAFQGEALVINFDSWVIGAHVPTIAAFMAFCLTNHFTVTLTYQPRNSGAPKVIHFQP
jgi:hypothetical protein